MVRSPLSSIFARCELAVCADTPATRANSPAESVSPFINENRMLARPGSPTSCATSASLGPTVTIVVSASQFKRKAQPLRCVSRHKRNPLCSKFEPKSDYKYCLFRRLPDETQPQRQMERAHQQVSRALPARAQATPSPIAQNTSAAPMAAMSMTIAKFRTAARRCVRATRAVRWRLGPDCVLHHSSLQGSAGRSGELRHPSN